MSKETLEHLNTNVLIGFTEQRGHAWHWRANLHGGEPNHYPDAIPVADVRRRLFGWTAESCRVAAEIPADFATMTHLNGDGQPVCWAVLLDRQAIARSDNWFVMGVFSESYQRHQYDDWLVTTIANVLDDTLAISSAGLLRNGAVAWVEVSVPETISTPEGVDFRPNLLATTSFDGSIATTFKRTVTATVCDNTRELALAEPGQQYKVKHSRHSHLRIADARSALALVYTLADEFSNEVRVLCETAVSPKQWTAFLDAIVPRTDELGHPLGKRGLTNADRKRSTLERLYDHDVRVAPWRGTSYGVVQAVNTWAQHEATVRGSSRAERNMLMVVAGDIGKLDRSTCSTLETVLATS